MQLATSIRALAGSMLNLRLRIRSDPRKLKRSLETSNVYRLPCSCNECNTHLDDHSIALMLQTKVGEQIRKPLVTTHFAISP